MESQVDLLSPLTIRGIQFRNRIVVSPMCQYCAHDGFADDWHLVHLGSRAVGGAALVFTEATSVTAQGRISPGDLGLWKEEHVTMLSRIAAFIHRMGAVAGIQLAHAGRKGSCMPPFKEKGRFIKKEEGGWEIVAPSPIPFYPGDPAPTELSFPAIKQVINDFAAAAARAVKAGFKVIEIHCAHGYLLNSFLSPLTNHRKDSYGGSLENRMRLLIEIVNEIRLIIPQEMPLFVRISATDWAEGGFDLQQSIALAKALKGVGVDLIDVSSGGVVPHVKIPVGPGYQVPLAAAIKKEANILTGAVGMITEPKQANAIIEKQEADLVFFAREMLRNPYFALNAEKAMMHPIDWPEQYGYAVNR